MRQVKLKHISTFAFPSLSDTLFVLNFRFAADQNTADVRKQSGKNLINWAEIVRFLSKLTKFLN